MGTPDRPFIYWTERELNKFFDEAARYRPSRSDGLYFYANVLSHLVNIDLKNDVDIKESDMSIEELITDSNKHSL